MRPPLLLDSLAQGVEPFEVADGVEIPPGSCDWRRYRVEVETAGKRKLSGQASWWFGGFYTGTLHQVELESAYTPSPLVTLFVNVEHDSGRLEQGDFDLTEPLVKLQYTVRRQEGWSRLRVPWVARTRLLACTGSPSPSRSTTTTCSRSSRWAWRSSS